MTTTPLMIPVRGLQLSGRLSVPVGVPRALVVALHGGSVTSGIYDEVIPGESSFLDIGAQLGFTVVALDRPGYGASAHIPAELTTFDEQVTILSEAVSRAWEQFGADTDGVFLTGNSVGGMLALCLAANSLKVPLLGVSTHGAGSTWLPGFVERLQGLLEHSASTRIDPRGRSTEVYGPEWTWPEDALPRLQDSSVPVTADELHDALLWPERLRRIAPSVSAPVSITIAEYDDRWSAAADVLDELGRIFSSALFVDVRCQRFVGHQLCADFASRAFYLHELAFAEECRVAAVRVPR